MAVYLRFRDLKARGIVSNWPTLQNRIQKFGFPRGRLIGPNARAWTEEEVEAWINSRPIAPKPGPKRRETAEKNLGVKPRAFDFTET
jgi:predicted DNA-binding transcriptional regulator AlpA